MGVAVALVVGVLTSVGGSTPTAHAVGTPIEVLDGVCSLQDAIHAVNTKSTVGGCVYDPADATNVIRITNGSGFGGTYAQTSFPGVFTPFDLAQGPTIGGGTTAYPSITTNVIIEGFGTNPAITDRLSIIMDPGPLGAGGTTRAFHVGTTGRLTLRNLNLLGFGIAGNDSDFNAQGGAIYATGRVALENVTLAGNSATGKQPPSFRSSRNPGDAQGGAIYSTSEVTASRTVFTNNRVVGSAGRPGAFFDWMETGYLKADRVSRDPERNPNGARGGNAFGADVALGPTGRFTAVDTMFVSSRATGGNGTPGDIDGPTYHNGVAGAPGPNVDCRDADDGGNGENGENGTNGGAAGDAAGVIHGGSAVTLDHVSIIDAVAVGGGAGKAGPPGVGGNGGRGGNAGTCGSYTLTFPGNGGDGGNGGNNGFPGTPGERATAVATIDATENVVLSNTTIVASSAIVSPDVTTARIETQLVKARTEIGEGGAGGTGTGTNGTDGVDGVSTRREMLANSSRTDPGNAIGLLSSPSSTLRMSSSTIADITLAYPPLSINDGRGQNLYEALTEATGTVASGNGAVGSILWSPSAPRIDCPNLQSAGYNVLDECIPASARRAEDRVPTARPLALPTPYGAVVRPPLDPFTPAFRMFVVPVEPGSPAIDLGRASVGSPACPAFAGVTPVSDDARRQPRDLRCDAGAFEFDSTPAALSVSLPDTIWVSDRQGDRLAFVVIGEPTTLGAGATLRVEADRANVQIFGPPEFDSTTGSMPVSGSVPQFLQFQIFAGPGAVPGPVTVTATLDPGGSAAGTQVVASDTATLVDDFRLEVTSPDPEPVVTCDTAEITYVSTATGRSLPRDRAITVWPSRDVWTRTVAAPTYTERVLVGDDTTTIYTNGQRIVRRAQVDLGRGFFEPFTFDPIMVRPMTEFLRLELSGLPTVDGDYVMRPGETKLVTTKLGNFNPTTPCGEISDISSIRIVGLGGTQVLHDPKDGVVDIGASLPFADTPWSSGGPLTAPMEPGRYTFHWELVIPGLEDAFNLTQEFVVQAIEVSVLSETSDAPEGDAASSVRRFEVTLDAPANAPVSVDWTTVDDSATAGSDYVADSGTVTFAPGETSKFVEVDVNGDTTAESDESFLVQLASPTGGLGGGARIVREIAATALVDDDAAPPTLPAFDVADVAVTEGNAGTTTLTFTVQASAPVPQAAPNSASPAPTAPPPPAPTSSPSTHPSPSPKATPPPPSTSPSTVTSSTRTTKPSPSNSPGPAP